MKNEPVPNQATASAPVLSQPVLSQTDAAQQRDWELNCLQARLMRHAILYALVHIACWLVWYILPHTDHVLGLWPVYPMAGWGVNLLFATAEVRILASTARTHTPEAKRTSPHLCLVY